MLDAPRSRAGLSERWQRRFEILDRIDGDILGRWKELAARDRMAVGFRLAPFVCSFLYYFAKGMWQKGFLLATGYAVLGVALGALGVPGLVTWFACAGFCAGMATGDYYTRVEHGERVWPVIVRRAPWYLVSTPALAVLAAVALGCHVAIAVQS